MRFASAMAGRKVASFFGADELQASGQTGRVAEKQIGAARPNRSGATTGSRGALSQGAPLCLCAAAADCISLFREML
ncbi:hypothetical protein IP86_07990 [Rhodopseudomonas sp. AAP120]|uniref:hypothetical protein n=1 Tax=Rhodopseudomonas sp. AAP120 TaxID=1523430 RepID=UPI0006B8CCA8|nr:hypothetical protein [Rhodopseudomonas sp. AAP120]KPF99890.1 hypothetical protein IP86_07990 [Rhodopseudomonas sp. AAP120]